MPQAVDLIAGLVLQPASGDVQDQAVAWYFLVSLDPDYVSCLDASPGAHFEGLAPGLVACKLLDVLAVDLLRSSCELQVLGEVEESYAYDTHECDDCQLGDVLKSPFATDSEDQEVN